ncbi:protein bicaudal D homolog [Fodinisporobacter ferrooxydans]|uniref:Protein bicaudal D homolog n=1 Tax=Fodinisporobacter ferrooxydans TaxID=2901836 RepID=A0ABY4CL58_9BACL|nr:protein bicaudal D homolog [Alicyclobacillaceae bacterium MYW30-H2]
MIDYEEQLQEALMEIQRLREENANLKRELSKFAGLGSSLPIEETACFSPAKVDNMDQSQEFNNNSVVHKYSSSSEKIFYFATYSKAAKMFSQSVGKTNPGGLATHRLAEMNGRIFAKNRT